MTYLLRLSERPRSPTKKMAFAAHRLLTYGVLGVFFEIAFYPLVRIGRMVPIVKYFFLFDWKVDPRLCLDGPWHSPLITLFGQSSLWMIPVYVSSALVIETLYRTLAFRWRFIYRAPVYGIIILACEWITGCVTRMITGYELWMYTDSWNIMQMTSFHILPMWIIAGVLVELIYRELMDPEVRNKLELELDQLQQRTR